MTAGLTLWIAACAFGAQNGVPFETVNRLYNRWYDEYANSILGADKATRAAGELFYAILEAK